LKISLRSRCKNARNSRSSMNRRVSYLHYLDRERLNFKDKKQEEKQRTKDPEELMLHIQKEFRA
jgi:hypothetical protein